MGVYIVINFHPPFSLPRSFLIPKFPVITLFNLISSSPIYIYVYSSFLSPFPAPFSQSPNQIVVSLIKKLKFLEFTQAAVIFMIEMTMGPFVTTTFKRWSKTRNQAPERAWGFEGNIFVRSLKTQGTYQSTTHTQQTYVQVDITKNTAQRHIESCTTCSTEKCPMHSYVSKALLITVNLRVQGCPIYGHIIEHKRRPSARQQKLVNVAMFQERFIMLL